MGRLTGKVVLISGAARGQGAAEARLFVREGAKVVLGDVRHEEGRALAEELGPDACYGELDVRDEDAWRAVVALARETYGRLDALVNNAGIVRHQPLERTSVAEYREVVEVNQVGVFLGIRSVVPAMRAAGGGSIVNIASIGGLSGMPAMSAYCATKFAVVGMSRSAAMELGPSGIRVNSICPGHIDTPMNDLPKLNTQWLTRGLPLRRTGTAEEVAALALFLASDESSYCTGSEFVADGGRLAGTPLV
ncbi:SDR family NAD(P)-dependent oxidoreductase [Kitasatospora sp. NPDC101235]|uniref:SDR family NAD(P)-dependent oxidoreductase n=1 Tax=Kitasatospora sp. NPDC101235 TaxID=3364101 RepID=UPI00382938A3